jgi:hypothetical protein
LADGASGSRVALFLGEERVRAFAPPPFVIGVTFLNPKNVIWSTFAPFWLPTDKDATGL